MQPSRAQKGARHWPNLWGNGTKILALASGDGLPLAVTVKSASPAECQLIESLLAGSFFDELPARLIGDKAYNSDRLDETLATEYSIELIAPNRLRRGKT